MTRWYHHRDDVLTLTLHVQPGARRNEIVGLHGDGLKIKLVSPPLEGRANAALLKFVATTFAVPLRNVKLLQGGQSKHKVVSVFGSDIDPATLLTK